MSLSWPDHCFFRRLFSTLLVVLSLGGPTEAIAFAENQGRTPAEGARFARTVARLGEATLIAVAAKGAKNMATRGAGGSISKTLAAAEQKAAAAEAAMMQKILAEMPPRKNTTKSRIDGQLFQKHHIVSDKHDLTKNHDLWRLSGVNPNDRINRMFLPTKKGELVSTTERSIHQGRHLDVVNEHLAEKMTKQMIKGQQGGWTQPQYREALEGILQKERQILKSGERMLNKHHREWAKPLPKGGD